MANTDDHSLRPIFNRTTYTLDTKYDSPKKIISQEMPYVWFGNQIKKIIVTYTGYNESTKTEEIIHREMYEYDYENKTTKISFLKDYTNGWENIDDFPINENNYDKNWLDYIEDGIKEIKNHAFQNIGKLVYYSDRYKPFKYRINSIEDQMRICYAELQVNNSLDSNKLLLKIVEAPRISPKFNADYDVKNEIYNLNQSLLHISMIGGYNSSYSNSKLDWFKYVIQSDDAGDYYYESEKKYSEESYLSISLRNGTYIVGIVGVGTDGYEFIAPYRLSVSYEEKELPQIFSLENNSCEGTIDIDANMIVVDHKEDNYSFQDNTLLNIRNGYVNYYNLNIYNDFVLKTDLFKPKDNKEIICLGDGREYQNNNETISIKFHQYKSKGYFIATIKNSMLLATDMFEYNPDEYQRIRLVFKKEKDSYDLKAKIGGVWY